MTDSRTGLLLDWYDANRRDLPWRARPGVRPDPYAVWVSEIMLQQTTVAAAGPYFARFLSRWPDVEALAAASLDDVLVAWQGLGYYARARNLHACARTVRDRHGGRFPDDEAALRGLPGVGAYTAAAIAAIAFGRRTAAMDGNAERVISRAFRIETVLPAAKPALRAAALELVPADRPGDFAQALMDLGATTCLSRNPLCGICPWRDACEARAAGVAGRLPNKPPRRIRPVRRGIAYWTRNGRDEILLRRRPEEGLLGGMMEIPSGPWVEGEPPEAPPMKGGWEPSGLVVRHGFTHFVLELEIRIGRGRGPEPSGSVWVPASSLGDYALPTVMKKVAVLAADAERNASERRKL